ncbi:TPA: hypothetical protein DIV49_01065 [Candidatus Saccharibacteria bacterium]|nr:hypothetical protein [Candidatus Saccharibacteria bacterium]HRJ90645.1 hypothetical protein [Candidatus Saccharibacteria bacterium]
MYSKITDKQLDDWKKALAKSNIIYDTDEEYRDAMSNLTGFFNILIEIDLQQKSTVKSSSSSQEEH